MWVSWMHRILVEPGRRGKRQRGDHTVPANANIIDLVLSVAEAAAETSLEGGNMALAIFIPVLIISLLLGGAYIYLTRWGCRGWSRAGGSQGWLSIVLSSHTPRAWSWKSSVVPGALGGAGMRRGCASGISRCSRDSASPPRRCRYYSSLRLPLMYSHPYSQITVETEFDNPIYETGVSPAVLVLARDTPEGLGWLGTG